MDNDNALSYLVKMKGTNNQQLVRIDLGRSSNQGSSSTIKKSLFKTPGMEICREKLSTEGISERASNLISNTRRDETRANYELA